MEWNEVFHQQTEMQLYSQAQTESDHYALNSNVWNKHKYNFAFYLHSAQWYVSKSSAIKTIEITVPGKSVDSDPYNKK